MALALRLTALRAGAGVDLSAADFEALKQKELREAGADEEVIANAMGVPGPWPRRAPEETLEEAWRMLGERSWRERVWLWLKRFVREVLAE